VASPDVVMFIRHGEKPGDDGPPHGINHDGQHDPHSLSVRGWTRAGALTGLFAYSPTASHPHIVAPERLVATKSTSDYRSRREVDTASPLARRLGLPIDEDFDHGQAKALSRSILADPRPTLVVWHHGSMPDLLAHFPVINSEDVPEPWPHDRFDLIWVLVREPDSGDYRFVSVEQALLEGDAPVPRRSAGPGA
jgi:broad specificity phosphatase PhoE